MNTNMNSVLSISTATILSPNTYQKPRDFIAWLLLEAAKHGVKGRTKNKFFSVVVSITPELAIHLLDILYERQRGNSTSCVTKYVQDMTMDLWPEFGDTMHLDTRGRLVNGQRRCHAIAATKKPLTTILTVTSDPRAYASMDAGQTRSVADYVMSMTGMKLYSKDITAMLFEQDNFTNNKSSKVVRAVRVVGYDQLDLYQKLKTSLDPNVKWRAGAFAGALRCMRMDQKKAFQFFGAVLGYQAHIRRKPIPVIMDLYAAWAEVEAKWGHPVKQYDADFAMQAFLHWVKNPYVELERSVTRGKQARHGLMWPDLKPYIPRISRPEDEVQDEAA